MNPIRRKIGLAELEGKVCDWMYEYGDAFPALRDLLHEVTVEIDLTRERSHP